MVDRFDIVQAYYFFFREYHTGIGSREYRRLSKIKTYYFPSRRDQESMTDNAQEIYNLLVEAV